MNIPSEISDAIDRCVTCLRSEEIETRCRWTGRIVIRYDPWREPYSDIVVWFYGYHQEMLNVVRTSSDGTVVTSLGNPNDVATKLASELALALAKPGRERDDIFWWKGDMLFKHDPHDDPFHLQEPPNVKVILRDTANIIRSMKSITL